MCGKKVVRLLLTLMMLIGVLQSSVAYAAGDSAAAVAPKALAFDGVVSKMAVGETQQLDVRITKVQTSDTVLLGYSSDNDAVATVNASGYVTAHGKGSANIEVYPCKIEDGEKIPIGDAKIRKKVKITVSDVAAPKISKVVPKDTCADVLYIKPNGYRRELYVLKGKRTEADFKRTLSAAADNGNSVFVYAGIVADEIIDKKGMVLNQRVSGLVPDTEYTVYVRNVSGVRTLNGFQQVGASTAGTVNTFHTISPQAVQINAYFDQTISGQTAKGEQELYDSASRDYPYYTANLADKSAKLSVEGNFREGDGRDKWNTLPLASDIKNAYTAPKMAYYVSDREYDADNREGTRVCVNGHYYDRTSGVAGVDKSGKITFQGRSYSGSSFGDCVYIVAVDMNTGIGDVEKLFIQSSPDSITGKAMKLQVGQSARLSEYIEYKEQKATIVNYQRRYADLRISQESDDYFRIEKTDDGDYLITALKEGGRLELAVTDTAVDAKGGTAATVRLTSSAMEPVKKLKAQDVYDNRFTVTFTYPVNPADCLGTNRAAETISAHDFQFELRDGGDSVISSQTETMTGTYDSKTKKMVYQKTFFGSEIRLLSKYKLYVRAVCKDPFTNESKTSKEAKLAIKTTNIPASYNALTPQEKNAGSDIAVSVVGENGKAILLKKKPMLKTGNTYMLTMELTGENDNPEAKTKMTDKLTWTVKNKKIASVKADKGGYGAALKTLRQGETDIEVKSKITKKVIARWTLKVSAVGSMGDSYGEEEPGTEPSTEPGSEPSTEPSSEPGTEPGSEPSTEPDSEPSTEPGSEPSTEPGSEPSTEPSSKPSTEESSELSTEPTTEPSSEPSTEEDSFLTLDDSGTQVVLGESGEQWLVYTAAQENLYTFYTTDTTDAITLEYYKNSKAACEKSVNSENGKDVSLEVPVEFEAEETKQVLYLRMYSANATGENPVKATLSVKKREVEQEALRLDDMGIEVEIGKDGEKWYAFTAQEPNCYVFYSENDTYTPMMSSYRRLSDMLPMESHSQNGNPAETWKYTTIRDCEVSMKAGETVYVKIRPNNADEQDNGQDTPVNVAIKVQKREVEQLVTVGEEPVSISLGCDWKIYWYEIAAEESDLYHFLFERVSEGMGDTIQYGIYTTLADKGPYFGDWNYIYGFQTSSELSSIPVQKGKSVYLMAVALSSSMQVKMTATKERVYEEQRLTLAEDGVAVTLAPGEAKYFLFDAEESATYRFYSTKATAGVTAAYYDSLTAREEAGTFAGTSDDPNFDTGYQSVRAGTQVCLKLQATDDTAVEPVTLRVKAQKYNVRELNLDDTGEMVSSAESTGDQWFRFTAQEEGHYCFTSESDSSNILQYMWLFDSLAPENDNDAAASDNGNGDLACRVHLSKNQTIYVRMRFGALDQSAVLAVEKIEEIDESGSIAVSLKASGSKELCYQLPKDGSYTIRFKRAQSGGSVNAQMWLNKAASKTTKVVFYPQMSHTYSYRRAGELLHILLWETDGVSNEVEIAILVQESAGTNGLSDEEENRGEEENADAEPSGEEAFEEEASEEENADAEPSDRDDASGSSEETVAEEPVAIETDSDADEVSAEEHFDMEEIGTIKEE